MLNPESSICSGLLAQGTSRWGGAGQDGPEFPRWWAQHKVLDRTWGHKRFRHPVVGPLEIDYEARCIYRAIPTRPSSCTGLPTATPAPLRH